MAEELNVSVLPRAFYQVLTETLAPNIATLCEHFDEEEVVRAAMMGAASFVCALWFGSAEKVGIELRLARGAMDAAMNDSWRQLVTEKLMPPVVQNGD